MSKEKLREIVSKAGKKAHKLGKAHKWTKEEAQRAGRKGGIANFQKAYEKRLRLVKSIKPE